MVAPDIQAIQRKLTVIAVALLVGVGAASTVALVPSLTSNSGPGKTMTFNVTFAMMNGTGDGATGNIAYRGAQDVTVDLAQVNMTNVTFMVSYRDNSISPFTNPSVNVQIVGPEASETGGGSVSTGGTPFNVPVDNQAPANGTVEASSESDALAKTTGEANNTSMGVGTWTVSFSVGSPLGGVIRPQGSITYTIQVTYVFFEGRAQRV